jgi:hypothetical protein
LGFWKFPKNLIGFIEELVKEPKLWGLGSLTNSFGFLKSIVMSENQSFYFLKIAGHGFIIPRPYLPILSSKIREDRTMFFFGKCFFSKWQNFKILKVFYSPNLEKNLYFLEFARFYPKFQYVVKSIVQFLFSYLFFYCHIWLNSHFSYITKLKRKTLTWKLKEQPNNNVKSPYIITISLGLPLIST